MDFVESEEAMGQAEGANKPDARKLSEEEPIPTANQVNPSSRRMGPYEKVQIEEPNKNKKASFNGKMLVRCGIAIIFLSALVLAFLYSSEISKSDNIRTSASLQAGGLTAIFLVVNDESLALKSIRSFLKYNTCSKLIVASHAPLSEKVSEHLKNAIFVIEKRPDYDIYFVDGLVSKVQTQFFFYATTEWEFGDSKLVDFSLQILKEFPEVGQVLPNFDQGQFLLLSSKHQGFSFLPGIHRKSHYFLDKDGYVGISKGQIGLKAAEKRISEFYLSKGIYILPSPSNFNIIRIEGGNTKMRDTTKQGQKAFYPFKKEEKEVPPPAIVKPTENRPIDFSVFSRSPFPEEEKGSKDERNLFVNRYHNAQTFTSFQEYLTHNRGRKLLLINCDDDCKQKYSKVPSQFLEFSIIKSIDEMLLKNQMLGASQVYDWISSQNIQGFVSTIIQKKLQIGQYAKYGVSLRWERINYDPVAVQKIKEYFEGKGFWFDEATSLNLQRVEQKMLLIFLKGEKQGSKQKNKNILGIHTVFRLRHNIGHLRQWIIYHRNLGFDKFFLYDNSNSRAMDPNSNESMTKTKQGMSLDCFGLTEEDFTDMWRYTWTEFYDHIVYIPWEPKDESGNPIYGLVQAQNDYLSYYKDVAKYTLFIEVSQLLFSPGNSDLIPFLDHYLQNRITSIKFKERQFLHRFCAKNQRLTEIVHYFPQKEEKLEGVRVIAQTASFMPFENLSNGRTLKGKQIVVAEDQFRVNSYTFELNSLNYAKDHGYEQAWEFQVDNGTLRFKPIMDKLCDKKCSELFASNCPSGKEWKNCLDTNRYYSLTGSIAIIRPGQKVTQTKPETQPKPEPQPQPKPKPKPQPAHKPGIQTFQSTSSYAAKLETWLRKPQKFYEFEKLKEMKDLPMCLVVLPSQKYPEQDLLSSINLQKYVNYKSFTPPAEADNSEVNFFYYKTKIEQKCDKNALIMFINAPLKEGALKYINENLQTFYSWVAYSKSGGALEVIAFYYRIYELLETNDFRKTNLEFLKGNNREVQTLGMLELCQNYNSEIDKEKVFDKNQPLYFSVSKSNGKAYDRAAYLKLIRLSQDIEVNVPMYQSKKGGIAGLKPSPVMRMTVEHMFRASNRQDEWYLPDNHTIEQLQYEQFSAAYKINEYGSKEKQVRFCVTILSHNNIQHNRYVKVMRSIVMQKYENYHIVFIDDNSTDNNMRATIDYMDSIKFPRDRITYVQNLNRNYATYNILNAAFNYCHEDDVQMLMDGDDEFIGKYAFQVMNSAYQQQKDLWVAYSNYKTNHYGWGRSRAMNSEFDHAANGRRSYISLFGAIRSWRVKVVYHIPIVYHREQDGKWLDTVYDDALGHCLFQLSSVLRVKYISQILYEYNIWYGDNDDSTSQKIKHRGEAYRYIIGLPTLKKLQTLDGTVKDKEVDLALKNDKGIKYKVIES